MSVSSNPNSHSYGSKNFLVVRGWSGYRDDGSSGNTFPTHETAPWIVASDDEVVELCKKYVELAKGDNDFAEYLRSVKMYISPFVDFSEIE